MTSCQCSQGPGNGCHLCQPDKLVEYYKNFWRPKRGDEMNKHHLKKINDEFDKASREFNRGFDKASREFNKGIPDEGRKKPVTKLLGKNHSPMIIRKFQGFGWPLFVALICDQDLEDLDEVVTGFIQDCDEIQLNNIQMLRDFNGSLSQVLVDHYNEKKYGCVEGVAVISYWDKCLCSSLYGDHMTHHQCRTELFTLLNMMTQM